MTALAQPTGLPYLVIIATRDRARHRRRARTPLATGGSDAVSIEKYGQKSSPRLPGGSFVNGRYPKLFSEWRVRNTKIRNRIVFPPTCPTWTDGGVLTDMATAYYRERARGGVGLIIIGATHVHPSSLASPLIVPQLFNDANIEPLSRIAKAVPDEGAKLAIQLWHSGVRGMPNPKMDPGADFDSTWYAYSPSQVPLGDYPGASTPKAMSEAEIEEIIAAYGAAAQRAIAADLDGVEFHMSHGYLPWQFLSPLYNKRTDRWGGSFENRLRFPVEAIRAIRRSIGSEPFIGYRINSTSFWPGDLEIDEVKKIVAALERHVDTDYVSVSAGVHHSFIHTPMHFAGGWERRYARDIRSISSKPVLLVGRITTPDVAEELLEAGDGDAICLARQLFTDPEWANKARDGREEDIRRCVAANHCWRNAATGQRVQCIYNPEIGREGKWGAGAWFASRNRKRCLSSVPGRQASNSPVSPRRTDIRSSSARKSARSAAMCDCSRCCPTARSS
jgi:2,4-dienoyl-CoA reductase-like NADH-dependent reductase (Old Yellow Enzyme family)